MNVILPIDWLDAAEHPHPPDAASWTSLPPAERLLLWSLRHMLVCWPSCASVRCALLRAYGDDALGVEHLLRCLLTAIGGWSTRTLQVGDPACARLLDDEATILAVLRNAGPDPAEAAAALHELCPAPHAPRLLPLAASLAALAGVEAPMSLEH